MRKIIAVLCAFLIFAMGFTPFAFASGIQKYAPDRILVGFKPGVAQSVKAKIHSKHGGRVLKENTDLGVQVVQVPSGKVMEKIAEYQSEKDVAFAEPDYVAKATFIPNDPYFSMQWGLNNPNDADIDAPEAWDVSKGNSVKVAVLDTGIDQNHEDLAGKIVANVNFTSSPNGQ
ncbi:MAG: S8 family serine peptidase [Desulfofundulus sp.]